MGDGDDNISFGTAARIAAHTLPVRHILLRKVLAPTLLLANCVNLFQTIEVSQHYCYSCLNPVADQGPPGP